MTQERGTLTDPLAGVNLEARVQQDARRESRSGLGKLLFDLRHRRRRFRQLVGVLFVVLLTWLGTPVEALFWIGLALACLGMAVRVWASGYVMKNEVLATVGPYAFVRHPLYVGNLLICAGFCSASGLWWSAPAAIVMLLLFYPETIRYEDQKLRRLFPDQWDRWAAGTRALLPRLTPYPGSGEAVPWSLSRSLLRNGEPLHVLLLGAGLVILYLRIG
jgi:protein-S-isoprenylcysteine O-methyltransferase Ste14